MSFRLSIVLFMPSVLSARICRDVPMSAGGLRQIQAGARLGDENGRFSRNEDGEQRSTRRAAGEGNRGDPDQALEHDSDLGVRPQRSGAVDRDGDDDPARIVFVELQARHLSDADAVELDRGAEPATRRRNFEPNPVKLAGAEAEVVVQPIDEAEDGDDDRQHGDADRHVARICFHRSGLNLRFDRGFATALACDCHENRPSPRDARRRARSRSDPRRRSCLRRALRSDRKRRRGCRDRG